MEEVAPHALLVHMGEHSLKAKGGDDGGQAPGAKPPAVHIYQVLGNDLVYRWVGCAVTWGVFWHTVCCDMECAAVAWGVLL